MEATNWTAARLVALFDEYRTQFWPEHPTLPAYRVECCRLDLGSGECDFDARVLRIDLAKEDSDEDVRSTLLHEMVHAVVGRGGHDAAFWEQLEYLLERHAPLVLTRGELGECGQGLHVVPERFVLARRAFQPVEDARLAEHLEAEREHGLLELTPEMLETEVSDIVIGSQKDLSWEIVWSYISHEYDLQDLDGRVLPDCEAYHTAARRGWKHGRAERRAEP
jgi:hypothetical protein